MPHNYLNSCPAAQSPGDLLRQIDGSMLPARASERHHQVLKPTLLIVAHAGVYQRHHAGQKLMDAVLLIQIIDYRSVLPGESLKLFFAPGIGQAATVENEPAAIPTLIFGQASMKRKTEDPHD